MVSNSLSNEAFLKRLHPDEQKVHSTFANTNKPVLWLPDGFEPGPYDVVISHGKESQHIGNKRFRVCVESNIESYMKAQSRQEKSAVISLIIEAVRQKASTSNGGFVCKDRLSQRWFHVRCKVARDKVGNALRDAIKQRYPLFSKKRRLDGTMPTGSSSSLESHTSRSSNIGSGSGHSFNHRSGINQSMLNVTQNNMAASLDVLGSLGQQASGKRSRMATLPPFAVETKVVNKSGLLSSTGVSGNDGIGANVNMDANAIINANLMTGNVGSNNNGGSANGMLGRPPFTSSMAQQQQRGEPTNSTTSFADIMAFGNSSLGELDNPLQYGKSADSKLMGGDVIATDLQSMFEAGPPSNLLMQQQQQQSLFPLSANTDPKPFQSKAGLSSAAAMGATDPFSPFDMSSLEATSQNFGVNGNNASSLLPTNPMSLSLNQGKAQQQHPQGGLELFQMQQQQQQRINSATARLVELEQQLERQSSLMKMNSQMSSQLEQFSAAPSMQIGSATLPSMVSSNQALPPFSSALFDANASSMATSAAATSGINSSNSIATDLLLGNMTNGVAPGPVSSSNLGSFSFAANLGIGGAGSNNGGGRRNGNINDNSNGSIS